MVWFNTQGLGASRNICGLRIGPTTRSSVSKSVAAVHQHHLVCYILWHIEDFYGNNSCIVQSNLWPCWPASHHCWKLWWNLIVWGFVVLLQYKMYHGLLLSLHDICVKVDANDCRFIGTVTFAICRHKWILGSHCWQWYTVTYICWHEVVVVVWEWVCC